VSCGRQAQDDSRLLGAPHREEAKEMSSICTRCPLLQLQCCGPSPTEVFGNIVTSVPLGCVHVLHRRGGAHAMCSRRSQPKWQPTPAWALPPHLIKQLMTAGGVINSTLAASTSIWFYIRP
jgi:hypothetical protein